MKALLLRVGIDKGSDGILAPIFQDQTFEYIPLSEKDPHTREKRTYHDLISNNGSKLSNFIPEKIKNRKVHNDPDFKDFTYADQGIKAKYLQKLEKGDYLVFYAGLRKYNSTKEGLYLIGFLEIDKIINFSELSINEKKRIRKIYKHNSHLKRASDDLTIAIGTKNSRLFTKAIAISSYRLDKRGRRYHAVSEEMEKLLDIKGSIQRSIPPRIITGEPFITNLVDIIKSNP